MKSIVQEKYGSLDALKFQDVDRPAVGEVFGETIRACFDIPAPDH